MLAEVILCCLHFSSEELCVHYQDSERSDSCLILVVVYRSIIYETVNTLLLAFLLSFFFSYSELHDSVKNFAILARTQQT